MAFVLTEDQSLFRRTVREFAQREIAPVAAHYDETEEYPEPSIRKMAQLGLMGLTVPEEYGGGGGGAVEYAIAMEEIARADAAHSTILTVNVSLVTEPLSKYGTDVQRGRYLPPLCNGTMVGADCLSEPASGSDAANMATKATKHGSIWVLSGVKNFITNGGVAGVYIVYANTDPTKGARGVTAFIVEADQPGVRAGHREKKLGIRASPTTQMFFDRVEIEGDRVLGEEDQGFRLAMSTLDGGRIGIAGQAVGIGAAALEAARRYAKERTSFGHPIADFQGLQWTLADMATRLEAARVLTLQAAWLKDHQEPYSRQASMAKLFASEMAMWVTTKAVQIHGGYGYMRESAVQRYVRDAKITEIYEGTSEIQRLVISRHLLKD
ncbi:MAG: acyl-CoA dehydrogenase family protein [Chloroflexi bacterium]|nr:acyl-CoA dehydrogenase family protein [Chloroflexota bacterium]